MPGGLIGAFAGFPKQSYIDLGPFRSPGVATVKGLELDRNWNAPQSYGVSGAKLTYVGQAPIEFTVDIDLWEPAHFLEWNLFSQVLGAPLPGVAGVALGIKHPIINGPPHGITAVVVKKVSQPVQNDTGKWTYTIGFLEWRLPLPSGLARPIADVPAAEAPTPTAKDANEAEMAALWAQVGTLKR